MNIPFGGFQGFSGGFFPSGEWQGYPPMMMGQPMGQPMGYVPPMMDQTGPHGLKRQRDG